MCTGPLPVVPLPLPPPEPQAARSTPARAAEVAATAVRRRERGVGFLVEDMSNLLGVVPEGRGEGGKAEVRRTQGSARRAEGVRAPRLR
jgi:hypothetical protein